MNRAAFLCCTVLLAACSTELVRQGVPEERVVRVEADSSRANRVIPARGLVTSFVPLVPPVSGTSSCYGPTPIPSQSGTIHGLRFNTSPARQIAIIVDDSGETVHYNDLRGPIPVPGYPSERGDHTGITIDFRRPSVILQNAPAVGDADIGRYGFNGALEASELDTPRRWIDEIRSRCVDRAPRSVSSAPRFVGSR